ncbi:MAG: hypothetical protein Q8P95_00420 [bacterium]|nr:hypothetical protein [bacterium]
MTKKGPGSGSDEERRKRKRRGDGPAHRLDQERLSGRPKPRPDLLEEGSQPLKAEAARVRRHLVLSLTPTQLSILVAMFGAAILSLSVLLSTTGKKETLPKLPDSSLRNPNEQNEDRMEHREVIINGHRFELSAAQKNMQNLQRIMERAIDHLKTLGVKYSTPAEATPFPIKDDPESKDRGNYLSNLEGELDVYELADVHESHDPGKVLVLPNPRLARGITLKLSEFSSVEDGAITATHELLHQLIGVIPNAVWNEGLMEGVELLLGYMKLKQEHELGCSCETDEQCDELIFDKLFSASENDYVRQMKAAGIDNLPWKPLGFIDSFLTTTPNADIMSRYGTAVVWFKYLKDHPDFFAQFVEKIKQVHGIPQKTYIAERTLVQLSQEIEPDFSDWYHQQVVFQRPKVDQEIFGVGIDDNTQYGGERRLVFFAGVWKMKEIQVNKGIKITVLDLEPITPIEMRVYEERDGKIMVLSQRVDNMFKGGKTLFKLLPLKETDIKAEIKNPRTGEWTVVFDRTK